MNRKFVLIAFGYGIVGLIMGLYMAKTQDLTQKVTHVHIMLLGFVVSIIYGICHSLWLNNTKSIKLIYWQFYLHQIGTLVMNIGLFLLFANILNTIILGPILGIAALLTIIAMILMLLLLSQSQQW